LRLSAFARLQQRLMPDYPRPAAIYWWSMVSAGALLLVGCLVLLSAREAAVWWQIALATFLAALTGLFPIRMPGTRHSLVVGDVFTFLTLLLHGAPAAALVAAGEAGAGTFRSSTRWTSRLASPALATVSMLVVGSLFDAVRTALERAGPLPTAGLLGLAIVAGMVYFPVNATMVSGVLRLKASKRFFQLGDVISVFRWLGMATAGSATVAALLFESYRRAGPEVLGVMVPLLVMALVTLHFFFRNQESDLSSREREARAAARHLRELQASERRFHSAFNDAAIGMALINGEGRIVMCNPALQTLLGHGEAALAAGSASRWLAGEQAPWLEQELKRAGATDFTGFTKEVCTLRADGEVVWLMLHGARFGACDEGGPTVIVQVLDVTARRVAEAGLEHLAFHDPLTGLPNRRRFVEVLTQTLNLAPNPALGQMPSPAPTQGPPSREATSSGFAVMFLDFDRFKLVNDSLGHSAGDELLVQLARRIQDKLRPSDTFARLGGDEFALLARGVHDEGSARAVAERVVQALTTPFHIAGHAITVTASIGITFGAAGYATAEDMLRDADTAMYKAKSDGKARVAMFDRRLHEQVARRLRLEGELRQALDGALERSNAAAGGALSVAYQPVFDLERGQIVALEALVRWRHPVEGPLLPGAFLPVAEESGIMRGVSDFVLAKACRQIRDWQVSDPAWGQLRLAVNVSAEDLAEPHFEQRVARALAGSGLRAEHLTIELTENILMSRVEGARPALAALRRMGVQVAVDDFGTGYSSLAHLAHLPIDELKIDRSFVAHLHGDSDEAAVVRSIVQLGQALRKSIVAEGIEDDRQMAELRGMGCSRGQGYLLGEPLGAAQTAVLLHQHRGAPGALH
jgi:diguanylate cyclase (GGDEF)-like protein/PAS domain S-box-containing protein